MRKNYIKTLLFCLLLISHLEARMYHMNSSFDQPWENIQPFNELILTWNAKRPSEGQFLFYIRAKFETWTPWLLYATWGSNGQLSYQEKTPEESARVFQDTFEVLNEKKANGFQIKITCEGKASIKDIHSLHVYTNGDKKFEESIPSSSIYLKIPGLSQMKVNHERHKDLCSPTSTTAVTRYLSQNLSIDPVNFSNNVCDQGFDIFGNWVFNVAQAWTFLDAKWNCWVERLNSFSEVYSYLKQGTPVVVSVRGPLPGSASPYPSGHLIAVTGYDADKKRVLCMDPAFPSDVETQVSYDLNDFIQAWSRRGHVAYVFSGEKVDH